MRFKILLLILTIFISSCTVYAFKKDVREREAEYLLNVQKQEEKEKYERKKLDYKPSGYMTVDEYENLSRYRDKSNDEIKFPEPVKGSDMKYIPKPTYRIVGYNDPPGSPDLNITKKFYQLRQYNGQGITSPDYSIMVYPVVYYYPNSASTACDLFVIPLKKTGTPLSRIMSANAVHRIPEPILSTEKAIDNNYTFRTLTPIDFSSDGTKLLVKEKLGNSHDGIWQTNAIIYDFETKNSYNLVELRDSIIYYWKEYKNLRLDDVRWDIYPLGFLKDEPDRVAAYAYAYTGRRPIFLGIWSTDGEQSRLISFDIEQVAISVNGFKLVQDGVVQPIILEKEEEALKKSEELQKKADEEKMKADFKQMEIEYKQKLKEMDEEFKLKHKDYKMQQKIKGSTTFNETPAKFKELKIKQLQNEIKKEEKQLEKELNYIKKLDEKLQKSNQK